MTLYASGLGERFPDNRGRAGEQKARRCESELFLRSDRLPGEEEGTGGRLKPPLMIMF